MLSSSHSELRSKAEPTVITPIVSEDEWLRSLVALPASQPRGNSILFICAHPDDETLGAGCTIASLKIRGITITVAAVTNGEAAYPDDPHLSRLRIVEQECALTELGIRREMIVRINLPDSDVPSNEGTLTSMVVSLLSPTTLVLAPWVGDFHPNHEACGRAAVAAAKIVGSPVSFYMFWTWHRGTLEVLRQASFQRFSLNASAMCTRAKALQYHRSQLHRSAGNEILPTNLLAPMNRQFEVFIDA